MLKGCINNKSVIDYSNFIKEDFAEDPENIWTTTPLCRIFLSILNRSNFTLVKE
ncbi:hypothetical protein LEP1GSC172_3196 [Leptospira noguchii]|uniref:Uncharacterized protein n=2 Tax=Leptospira noguchii TaxID=28182 RepID=T0FRX8_9LEPT|nr:hypothetical protein LEP1GSC172_3196 [Leptospira noguchii]EQA72295.1 hypothetical protein LEP1GSC059_3772 [Leptospira noguchii serovar Panama str. CZ214]